MVTIIIGGFKEKYYGKLIFYNYLIKYLTLKFNEQFLANGRCFLFVGQIEFFHIRLDHLDLPEFKNFLQTNYGVGPLIPVIKCKVRIFFSIISCCQFRWYSSISSRYKRQRFFTTNPCKCKLRQFDDQKYLYFDKINLNKTRY